MKLVFKIILPILAVTIIVFLWFLNKQAKPVEYGVSFSRTYAEWLGLNWETVYGGILKDLNVKYLRLPAPWDEMEIKEGKFDFMALDWQMDEAKKENAKVVLVVGQKTPRWPECRWPDWSLKYSDGILEEKFLNYIDVVVKRYKEHPAMDFWQVENEPFIKFPFGECSRFKKDWVKKEIEVVRSLDPKHKIMLTDSGEMGFWWGASHKGDYFGTTLYRVVRSGSGGVYTYNFLPPVFYKIKGMILVKNFSEAMIAELQMEPWFGPGEIPLNTSVEKQEETFNPERLKKNIEYVGRTGFSRAYLWGAEWWYWMKEVKGDSRFWNGVKTEINKK